MANVVAVVAEGAGAAAQSTGVAPIWWGVGTFLALTALLAVTYAFRSVWTRH